MNKNSRFIYGLLIVFGIFGSCLARVTPDEVLAAQRQRVQDFEYIVRQTAREDADFYHGGPAGQMMADRSLANAKEALYEARKKLNALEAKYGVQ